MLFSIARTFYLLYRLIHCNLFSEEKELDKFIQSVKKSGCMCTKLVQWITPRLEINYKLESSLLKQIEVFYNHCETHSLEYTTHIYETSFGKSIYEDYELMEIIGSGSMGQVYKARGKKNNRMYAIKVLHPNVKYEFYLFWFLISCFSWIVPLQTYLPIQDIHDLFRDLQKQIDLTNEANHLLYFHSIHKQELFLIPQLFEISSQVLVMDYIESESIENISDIKRDFLFSKLLLYNLACSYYGKCHCDLHSGNWGFQKDKLVIYDYGFCEWVDSENYHLLEKIVFHPNIQDSFNEYINYHIVKNNHSLDLLDLYLESKECQLNRDTIVLSTMITNLFQFLRRHNIMISINSLNALISINNIEKLATHKTQTQLKQNVSKIVTHLIDLCDSYSIFSEFKQHLENTYTINDKVQEIDFSTYQFLHSSII